MTKMFIRPTAIVIAAVVGFAVHVAYAEIDDKKMSIGETCTAEGIRPATFQHLSCINDKVAARCVDSGTVGSRAHNICVEDTKSRAFTVETAER